MNSTCHLHVRNTHNSAAERGSREEEQEGVEAWGPAADARWPLLVAAVRKVRVHACTVSMYQPTPLSSFPTYMRIQARQRPAPLPPPLLLYFRWHNQPLPLAAHRARCLAALWAAAPEGEKGLGPVGRKLVAARDHLHAVAAEDPRSASDGWMDR